MVPALMQHHRSYGARFSKWNIQEALKYFSSGNTDLSKIKLHVGLVILLENRFVSYISNTLCDFFLNGKRVMGE